MRGQREPSPFGRTGFYERHVDPVLRTVTQVAIVTTLALGVTLALMPLDRPAWVDRGFFGAAATALMGSAVLIVFWSVRAVRVFSPSSPVESFERGASAPHTERP